METKKPRLQYFLYARKSSESEDRQVQSIDDQTGRLKRLAQELGITIKHIYTEAKSAKKPGNRPFFDKMMTEIESGEADGILCWHLNRLSRNPIDSGKISWLLQEGSIKSIQTMEKQFLPEDNVLLFSVESGMANQFCRELSTNVKRGIQKKLEDGWRPGIAPQGYLNELSNHTIIKDTERFNLIRKVWDLMLTGNYTVPQLLIKLNDEWGYKTPLKKRLGGKPLTISGLYKVFTNLFYTGIILHKDQTYPGKHDQMITLEEYDQVQLILGRKGKQRPKTHNFAFTGMIRCGECGCLHTAETKKKIIKKTGTLKEYTYYHCTRRKKDIDCSQRKVLNQDNLELQINELLATYTILPEFRDWALEIVHNSKNLEIEDKSKILDSLRNELLKAEENLNELIKMRYRKLIDDKFFIKEKETLQMQISKSKEKLKKSGGEKNKQLELTKKTFNFATYARINFNKGTLEQKREILAALGSNHRITDQKLFVDAHKWFQPIRKDYPRLEEEYIRLELNKSPLNKAKSEQLSSLITRWHGWRESNSR